MKIIIKQFDIKWMEDITASFVCSYSDWSCDSAHQYLSNAIMASPDFCFATVNEKDELMGAIFCKICPCCNGSMLIIESLQVIENFRNQKVGTSLIFHAINKARKHKIKKIGLMAFNKDPFPISWFKKIGFTETGWVELNAGIDDLG